LLLNTNYTGRQKHPELKGTKYFTNLTFSLSLGLCRIFEGFISWAYVYYYFELHTGDGHVPIPVLGFPPLSSRPGVANLFWLRAPRRAFQFKTGRMQKK
jgi:hypothetical protein